MSNFANLSPYCKSDYLCKSISILFNCCEMESRGDVLSMYGHELSIKMSRNLLLRCECETLQYFVWFSSVMFFTKIVLYVWLMLWDGIVRCSNFCLYTKYCDQSVTKYFISVRLVTDSQLNNYVIIFIKYVKLLWDDKPCSQDVRLYDKLVDWSFG